MAVIVPFEIVIFPAVPYLPAPMPAPSSDDAVKVVAEVIAIFPTVPLVPEPMPAPSDEPVEPDETLIAPVVEISMSPGNRPRYYRS